MLKRLHIHWILENMMGSFVSVEMVSWWRLAKYDNFRL